MLSIQLTTLLNGITDEVYPLEAPAGFSTPCVVYTIASTEPVDDLDGYANLAQSVVMIEVYSPRYLEAKTLAASIRATLLDWADVEAVTWVNETDTIDKTTQTSLHRTVMSFLITAAE
jgi:hypothetical protein